MKRASETPAPGFDARAPSRRGVKVLEFGLILVAFTLAVVWFIGSYPNRDGLWFLREFNEAPRVIRIYHYGTLRELRPGEAGYAEMTAAMQAAFTDHAGYIESLYPHDASYDFYTQQGYAIEFEFARPVQVHTSAYFPQAPRYMILIDGSYNYIGQGPMLFRGSFANYLPNGLVLRDIGPLQAQVDRLLAQPGGTARRGLAARP